MLASGPAAAESVKLKVLVVATGTEAVDQGLAYIKPVLDELGVPYAVLNAATTELTAGFLSPNGCQAEQTGCVGNYNGVILTDSWAGQNLTPAEWDMLHAYEAGFKVREVVLSGAPDQLWDPAPPGGIYLDYGFKASWESSTTCSKDIPCSATWTQTARDSKEIFEYVNKANSLPITDYAIGVVPRGDGSGPRDGTVPNVTPLLQNEQGGALVSLIQYSKDGQPVREVLLSTILNAGFLFHSQVLAYEFINWAAQGVFVGGRFVHMAAHLDDFFTEDELWDSATDQTTPSLTYRLNSNDIINAVNQQNAFRAAHPTAGAAFKLDFAFNGAGAVLDPAATTLTANLTEDLVAAVIANTTQFRFINHTLTHADMDKPPVPATAPCDYPTLTTVAAVQAEITKNRTVWGLLGLPEKSENNRVLVSGNHSGLKDRKCTDDPLLHPDMADVQSDDVPFQAGANPIFFKAAANAGVNYLASDASQTNQNVEMYATGVNDGTKQRRIILPRWPSNLFFNVKAPDEWVDEYNYLFHDRFVKAGQDPCTIAGAICAPRTLAEMLEAEADTALRHMMSYKKWPHFFHQTNLAAYDAAGNTLMFDWLNAVFAEYERYFILPVKNYPYFQIGDKTKAKLDAPVATIKAEWNRTTNKVSLSASNAVPKILVTGIEGGDLYGGQRIREVDVYKNLKPFKVDRALDQ